MRTTFLARVNRLLSLTTPLPRRSALALVTLLLFCAKTSGATLTSTPSPAPGSILTELTQINVVFSEAVQGVDAADLLINGLPALTIKTNNPNDYSFSVAQPADGTITLSWAAGNNIVSATPDATPFSGSPWTYLLDTQSGTNSTFLISEFMASNNNGIQDEDGDRSDWIEILNTGSQQATLEGWYLTDTLSIPTKWAFPAGMAPLQANGYLLVWASAKNKTNAQANLHTSFRLPASGGYLALVNPRTNVVSVFNPYPIQSSDISYGRDAVDPTRTGYFTNATPGKINAISGPGFAGAPVLSLNSGIYTNDSLLLTITAPPGTTVRYTLNGNIPATNSTLYTNALVLTNSTSIKARVFPGPGTNLFPSEVIARHILFLDNTTRDFNSELPLIVISTQGQAVAQDVPPGSKRTEGVIALIDTVGGRSSLRNHPDFIGNVGVEIFGQTSAGFEKKPYRLEIHDVLGNDFKIPVFGLPEESDFKMRNPFNDKSVLNDFLGTELFEKMGNYSVRRRYVEVFLDSGGGRLRYPTDYVGIEVLFENVEQGRDRVNIAKIPSTATNEPAITGGFIFAKDKDSPNDLNFNTAGGGGFNGQLLKLREPKPNELRPSPGASRLTPAGSNQLNYLVRYLNRMERAMYTNSWLTQTGTNHYSHYLDVDSFIDYHWLVEFTKQIDGIRLSSYFHKDLEGKVKAGPVWDWNLAFGNANYWRGGLTNGWYYAQDDQGMNADAHIWLRRLINGTPNLGAVNPSAWDLGSTPGSGGDPDFNQKIADRWSVLRTNIFNPTNLNARIDELSLWLNETVQRDLWGRYKSSIVGVYQWPNPEGTITPVNGSDASGRDVNYVGPILYRGQTHNSIIGQMKNFVLGRYLWIDQQFARTPSITPSGGPASPGIRVTITPPPNSTLYYTLDGLDPRQSGGSVRAGALSNAGPVTISVDSNVVVFARAYTTNTWYKTWSGPAIESYYLALPHLLISEILYRPVAPPAGSTNSASDFEFVEVKNTGFTTLNLEGFRITGGINFAFPSFELPAGERAVVVAQLEAFNSRYPDPSIRIAGTFTGSLNNNGDTLKLVGPRFEPIQSVTYDPRWYPATDGPGYALVKANEDSTTQDTGASSDWRQGGAIGGTPGKPETQLLLPSVVVNEILSHSPANDTDKIELLNLSPTPADISGWYLTDNPNSPKKYKIPANTILAAGGFKVFTEAEFNPGGKGFALSASGEEVYLFSADAAGNLTGYTHGFKFDAQLEGVSVGRFITDDGVERFDSLKSPTFGAPNSGPAIGPIVISEFHYHPPSIFKYGVIWNDTDSEYIELKNISTSRVSFYDALRPTNTWALQGDVTFAFPTHVSLEPGRHLLLVGFDPNHEQKMQAFRSAHGIPDGVLVLGPWDGQLPNSRGKIILAQPDQTVTNSAGIQTVPYVAVDRVHYSDSALWPRQADGQGASLQRLDVNGYGDNALNWRASRPGPAQDTTGVDTPTVLQQPTPITLVNSNGAVARFKVVAAGTPPLSYQWLFNGAPLPDAQSDVLTLDNLNPTKAGRYSVTVLGSGGTIQSSEAALTLIPSVLITTQPRPLNGRPGTNLVFSVGAAGQAPLSYQWFFNDQPLPGATGAQLNVNNLKLADDGFYHVVVTDAVSSIASDKVRLSVLINPVILVQPVSQNVIKGSTAVLSVVVSNTTTTPLGYRWRRGTATAQNQYTNSLVSYYVITNIQATVNYSVVITNAATRSGITSSNATLTVVNDSDSDGMPDDYELLYPGILNPNSASDATQDPDGDGMNNLAEYISGTDPTDPRSYLKVDSITHASQGTTLELFARSNRTYTVEFRESVSLGTWQTLTNIPAQPVERIESITDSLPPAGQRLYRIATPVLTDRAISTPVILQSPGSYTLNQGSPLTLTALAYGVGNVLYQWQMNDVDIPGATEPSLAFASLQAADQGSYTVVISDSTGTVTTSPAVITVLQPPQIVSTPQSQTVVQGQTARFLVGATSGSSSTGPLAYRWLFNNKVIEGADGPTLEIKGAQLTDQGAYRVVVSQLTANGLVSATTDPAYLVVLP